MTFIDQCTKVMQTYEEANNLTTVASILEGQDGLRDFSLVDNSAPAATAYCFRLVRSDANTLYGYTIVPQITTATSNVAPSPPTTLAQKTAGDVVLSTGAWHNATSVKFTATVTDPDATDTLALCVEKDLLGTGFAGTEDLCGTGLPTRAAPWRSV